jgi:hypothetical protein
MPDHQAEPTPLETGYVQRANTRACEIARPSRTSAPRGIGFPRAVRPSALGIERAPGGSRCMERRQTRFSSEARGLVWS